MKFISIIKTISIFVFLFLLYSFNINMLVADELSNEQLNEINSDIKKNEELLRVNKDDSNDQTDKMNPDLKNDEELLRLNQNDSNDQFDDEMKHDLQKESELLRLNNEKTIKSFLDEITKLKSKIESLTNEIDELKKNSISSREIEQYVTKEEMNDFNNDVKDQSEIVHINELKSCLDRLNITTEFRTRSDNFTFKGHVNDNPFDTNSRKYTYERVHSLISNRLRLNMNSKVGENVRFYSRVGIYYHWINQNIVPNSVFNYVNLEREPNNTMLKVERAYVDFFINAFDNLPIALSFGRLPSTDGLPTDLRENTPRKSTFPSIAYDIVTDGFGLSLNLSKITSMQDTYFRFMYCRQNYLNQDTIYRKNQYDLENLNIYISEIETSIPGKWKNGFFMLFYCWTDKCTPQNDLGKITVPSGTQLFPAPLPPTKKDSEILLEPIYIDSDSLGRANKFTLYLQFNDFLYSGLDWFASYNVSRTTPTSKAAVYGTKLANIDEELADAVGNINIPIITMGLLNDNNDKPYMGYAIHTGLRYTLPLPFLLNPKIGFEYVNNSKNWIGFTLASEDPLHKLDIRGEAKDLYYIQPINKAINIRFGYTYLNHDYDNGLGFYLNTPKPVDWKRTNTYVLVDAIF